MGVIVALVAGCGGGSDPAEQDASAQADEKARKISVVRRNPTSTGGGTTGTGTTGGVVTLPDVPTTRLDASRFLHQAAFGPNEPTLAQVQTQGPRKFLSAQFAATASRYANCITKPNCRSQRCCGFSPRSRKTATRGGA